jgi:hypothetical protein
MNEAEEIEYAYPQTGSDQSLHWMRDAKIAQGLE